MATVTISVESKRGCGYRRPGKKDYGLYLIGDGPSAPCGRLPFPLTICPCCGGGIKFSRGFTWIEPRELFASTVDAECDTPVCWACPMNNLHLKSLEKAGLLWIGEKFYKTAQDFMIESNRMGISRKIPNIPNDFKIGENWVFLAHSKAVPFKNEDGELDWMPGVFQAFQPKFIDFVIDDVDEIPAYAEKVQEDLGTDKIRIVKVVKDVDLGADNG